MASTYQIIASSPATGGTNVNSITGGGGSWKSLSNPSFVIVQLDCPSQIHHVQFGNAGSAFVEILGLPSSNKEQGANVKESEYKCIILSHTLVEPGDWKAQTNVDKEVDLTNIEEESLGETFSQIKVIVRGYSGGKAVGMKLLRFNGKAPSKPKNPASHSLPSLVLEAESDDESELVPSLKSGKSTILKNRMIELKEKLHEESMLVDEPEPAVEAPASVSYVVHVANEAEFEPGYEKRPVVFGSAPHPKPITKAPSSFPKASSTISKAPSVVTKASTLPVADESVPLASVILSVSGIGPERADIRSVVVELGGTYTHDWPASVPNGKTLVLLVDAPSDQWKGTPKHNSAVAMGCPVLDKSWLYACKSKSQLLAFGPYLAQFRTGEGKAAPASAPTAAPNYLVPPATKKATIKSEGGSFATNKKAKGDEYESDGPDDYEFGDFVVPDDAEIEYYEDGDMDIDEGINYPGLGGRSPAPAPKASPTNVPARLIFSNIEIEDRWANWLIKSHAIIHGSNDVPRVKPKTLEPKQESVFGMDVDEKSADDAASDGTNPIDAAELAELNRDMM